MGYAICTGYAVCFDTHLPGGRGGVGKKRSIKYKYMQLLIIFPDFRVLLDFTLPCVKVLVKRLNYV